MQLIEVILAFALLMVLFSSIASGFTELVLRVLPARSLNLRKAVRRFSEDILWPNYRDALAGGAVISATEKNAIIDRVTDDLTRNLTQPSPDAKVLDRLLSWQGRYWIDALSTRGFVERLAKSELGTVFAQEEADVRAARLRDISLSFERYMAMSAELFRKYAGLTAFAVSIFLAGFGNIHLGRVVEHLRQNPEVVALINAQEDEIAALEGQQADVVPDTVTSDELAARVDALRHELAGIQATYELPIGYDYYPYGDKLPYPHEDGAARGAMWTFHIIISGLLIGLGAPFWYRVVRNIGQIRASARAVVESSEELVSGAGSAQSLIDTAQAYADLFDTVAQLSKQRTVDDQPPPVG